MLKPTPENTSQYRINIPWPSQKVSRLGRCANPSILNSSHRAWFTYVAATPNRPRTHQRVFLTMSTSETARTKAAASVNSVIGLMATVTKPRTYASPVATSERYCSECRIIAAATAPRSDSPQIGDAITLAAETLCVAQAAAPVPARCRPALRWRGVSGQDSGAAWG